MSSYGGIEETQQSCFCNLFQNPERGDDKGVHFKAPKTNTSRLASRGATGEYTDTDLARDLNALTMEERQAIEEDIHGVIGVIPETEEFVEEKIKEMNMHLENIHPREKQAWDRAVFLRPSLEHDKALRMMSLRARRFQPRQAARVMIQLFEERSKFFGEDLSYQRLTWNDLTTKEQECIRSGVYQIIPGLEMTGRGIAFVRVCQWDAPNNHKMLIRCMHYMQSAIADDVEMQKCGVVTVADFGGRWKSTPLQILQFIASLPDIATANSVFRNPSIIDSSPFHEASTHILYSDMALDTLIRGFRRVFQASHHLRFRLHFGSAIETEYSLRTFGIDFSGLLGAGDKAGPLSEEKMEQDIQRRQQLDEEWRKMEAPYRDPSSQIALFPNPQDVIMGRNKKIATSWPGNIVYHSLIERYSGRYMEAQASDRVHLTMISLEIFHILQKDHGTRFLVRKESTWEVCDDAQVQKKIGQALRIHGRASITKSSQTAAGT